MDPKLFEACQGGDTHALEVLLKNDGPEILSDEATTQKNTALHIAAREGHSLFVEEVLSIRPSIAEKVIGDKNTALHQAAKGGDSEVVNILLEHTQSEYACSVKRDGHTESQYACKRNKYGETALLLASEEGHLSVVEQLLKVTPAKSVIGCKRWDGQTSLHVAASRGHTDVMKEIYKQCSNALDTVDVYGATPLHSAVDGGHIETIKEILKSQSGLCYTLDKLGNSPVHIAASEGHMPILLEFMSTRPDSMEIRSKDSKNALHFAVENNKKEIVDFLQQIPYIYKKLWNERDKRGNTALHLATMNDVHKEIVNMLLLSPSVSVNVNAVNHEGLNALDIAKGKDVDKAEVRQIIDVLIEKGATRSATWNSKEKHRTQVGNDRSLDMVTLVAVLIATVTFSAVFQMPGGLDEGEEIIAPAPSRAPPPSIAGIARFYSRRAFKVFIVSDSCAFFASVTVVLMWMILAPMQKRMSKTLIYISLIALGISLVFTCLAFLTAAIMVVKPSEPEKQDKHHLSLLLELILTAGLVPLITLILLVAGIIMKCYAACTYDEKTDLKEQLIGIVVFLALFIVIPLYVVFGAV